MIKSNREKTLEQRRLLEDSYEELYDNMTRDIESIWLSNFRDISDKELEDIVDMKHTNFLDKVTIILVREYGYTSEDIDEYGVREIRELLADIAMNGVAGIKVEKKQKTARANNINNVNKKLEQRISKLENQLRNSKVFKESYQKEESMVIVQTAKACELIDSMIDDMYADGSNEEAESWLSILDELRGLKSKMENLTYHS